MKKLLFYCLIATLLMASCKDKTVKKTAEPLSAVVVTDTSLKWVDYRIGELPPMGYYTAFDSVIKKWDIRYKRVNGGCEVNPVEQHHYEKDNSKYFAVLEQRFGKDWRKRFDAEVVALDKTIPRQYELEKQY